jgi:plasminogen activator inhibitor 1 RNA-binding protein
MESAYGVGITNRFSRFLITDSDDEEESKKQLEAANKTDNIKPSGEVAKTSASKPATEAKPKQFAEKGIKSNKENTVDRTKTATNELQKGGQDPKLKNKANFGDGDSRGNNSPIQQRSKAEPFGKSDRNTGYKNNPRYENAADRNFETSGEFRDPDYGRAKQGGRGGRGGQRPISRGREFDRRSGSDRSGVKPVNKKDGAGQRNWGSYKDDTGAHTPTGNENEANETEEKEKPEGGAEFAPEAPEGEPASSTNAKGSGPGEPEKEPEKPTMTLDQYKSLPNNQRQKPVFNVRKAGEGEDQSWMKKMTLVKKEKVDGEETDEDEEEEDEDPRRYGRQKKVIKMNFRFANPPTRRRGFGRGRGGQRGFDGPDEGRDMGPAAPAGDANFGDAQATPVRTSRIYEVTPSRGRQLDQYKPRVDDERDFPSLIG